MSIMTWLFGEKTLHEQKLSAEQSDAVLDHKIEQVQASSNRVVIQAEREKRKAQNVIDTAEEVIGSLRRYRELNQ